MQRRSALVGLAGGCFGGLTGTSGGAVQVPLLTGMLRLPQRRAHATSTAIAIATAAMGAAVYALRDAVDPALSLALIAGAIPGARWGARLLYRFHAATLRRAFAAFLLLAAIELLWAGPALPTTTGWPNESVVLLLAVVGAAGGVTAGLLGTGGGLVFVPALILLVGVPEILAQGTAHLAVAVTACAATADHARAGSVDTRVVRTAWPCAALAGPAAAGLATTLPADMLRLIFAAVLLVVAAELAWATRPAATRAHAPS